MNSLVYRTNNILYAFHQLSPKVNDETRTDGGMIRNKYLMQYLSSVTRKSAKIANISELSVLGGIMNVMHHFDGMRYLKTYTSRINKSIAKDYYNEWITWIKKLA